MNEDLNPAGRRRREIQQIQEECSPYVLMPEIIEKLKLLNYDQQFLRKNSFKPFNGVYFACPAKNPQEQFFHLSCLMEWLCSQCGLTYPTHPSLEDDPNSSVSTMMSQLKKNGFSADFPPSQLKQGYGQYVCMALSYMADSALQRNNVKILSPRFVKETAQDEVIEQGNDDKDDDDDEDEQGLLSDDDMVEDDEDDQTTLPPSSDPSSQPASSKKVRRKGKHKKGSNQEGGGDEDGYAGGDDEDLLGGEVINTNLGGVGQKEKENQDVSRPSYLPFASRSHFDPTQWRIESERVAPQLKIKQSVMQSQKDWFGHLEETKELLKKLLIAKKGVVNEINNIVKDIQLEMDKIESRERYFNQDSREVLERYKTSSEELKQVSDNVTKLTTEVDEMAMKLAELTEELDTIKNEMEEYGESVSNTQPLMRLKQAQQKIQVELKQINVRIGTLQHYLLQTAIADVEEKKINQTTNPAEKSLAAKLVPGEEEEDDDDGL